MNKKIELLFMILLLALLGCQTNAEPTTAPTQVAATEVAATETVPPTATTAPATATVASTNTAAPPETITPEPTISPPTATVTAEPEALNDTVQERLTAFVDSRAEAGIRGTVLVAQDGELLLASGFGLADDATGVPNDTNTIFDIGSLTKQFTAAAILKLEMEGLLTTDDLISDYFTAVPEDKQAITLHHLLTHSAGFPGAVGDDYDPILRAEFAELAFNTPLEFVPGSDFAYTNVGYSLLAAIIENVTGGSYERYLREALFVPAGMLHTGYTLPDWSGTTIADGYRGTESQGLPNQLLWADDGPYWHLRGNGGLLSSAEDMYRWHLALLDDTVLSDEARERYFAPHVAADPEGVEHYAYGWAIFPTERNTTLIAHNGGNGIFFADMWRFPEEGLVVFVATNQAIFGEHDSWTEDLSRIVFDPEFVPEPVATAVTIVPDPFPDTPAGQLAQQFLEAVSSGDEESQQTFIEATYDPDFLDIASMADHLAILGELDHYLADLQRGDIIDEGNMITLNYYNDLGRQTLKLILIVSESEPFLIEQIGLED